MSRIQVGVRLAVLLLIAASNLAVAACSQTPANVSRRGDKFYGFSESSYGDLVGVRPASDGVYDTVIVRKGDTVSVIAENNGVPTQQVINLNQLKAPFTIEIGQELKLQRAAKHTVAKGDTLNGVAREYGVEVAALAAANGIKSQDHIKVGQTLKMPYAAQLAKKDAAPAKAVAAAAPVERTLEQPKKPKNTAAKNNSGKEKTDRKNYALHSNSAKSLNAKSLSSKPLKAGSAPQFSWPLKGKIVQGFGAVKAGVYNDGINIAAQEGAQVRAAAQGEVVYAGNELKSYGNLLIIKHDGGWLTAYAHNKTIMVKRGQKVSKGEIVALVGASGKVDRPQLHFAVRKGREAVDPRNYISG